MRTIYFQYGDYAEIVTGAGYVCLTVHEPEEGATGHIHLTPEQCRDFRKALKAAEKACRARL